MLEINDKGVTAPNLDEIISEKSEGYRLIYGQDISIDADSPDGQRIGIESQAVKDAYDTLLYAIQMHDPQHAQGKWAEVIAKLSGIKRDKGKYTILPDVKFIIDRPVTILTTDVVEDSNGNKWFTERNVNLNVGENLVSLRSEFYGAVSLQIGAFMDTSEVKFGLKSITTTKTPVEGRLGESTAAMMSRRDRRLAINNTHDREGIEGSLLEVDGVVDALVLENNTDVIDSNGVNPHSINAIVLGGTDENIANTILRKIKGGGCGTTGEESFTILNYRGADRIIKFDRPTVKDIVVVVTLVRSRAQVDINIDAVKDAIVAKKFLIGQDIVAGMLYCFQHDGTFYVKSIKVDGGDVSAIGIRQVANVSRANVSVVIE